MREILFRGTCTETGDWVKGRYVLLFDDKGNRYYRIYPGYAESDCGDLYPDWYDVDPETVGQFTGITDKNGKKIFEGDIIRVGGDIYACCWDDGNVEFMVKNQKESFGIAYAAYPCMEVIGNIHDNPELLEES